MSIRTLIILPAFLAACVTGEPTEGRSMVAVSMSTAEAAVVLALVNYPGADITLLDVGAGLDRRAAEGIVAYRSGRDGVSPSADDRRFEDLAQLDAVSFVGDSAFEKLRTYALAHPVPAEEAVEGVLFRGWEAEAVVWGVNHATVEDLDVGLALNVRAATNLVAGAPYATVTAIGLVSNVGPATLGTLRTHAGAWWSRMHGETPPATVAYDGVAFDEATARVALQIANQATVEQLVAHGMWSTGANRIVVSRPFAGLDQVAALDDVGTATMRVLHDWAASATWTPAAPAECDVGLQARVDADVADFGRLLTLATTGDWPYAEMVALQVNQCIDIREAGQKDGVLDEILGGRVINWGYPDVWNYLSADDFAPGTAQYLARVDQARTAIQERVQEGRWVPRSADEQALYDRLGTLHANLTTAARAEPARFSETLVRIDAEECSQDAVLLVDSKDNRVIIIHRFPGC